MLMLDELTGWRSGLTEKSRTVIVGEHEGATCEPSGKHECVYPVHLHLALLTRPVSIKSTSFGVEKVKFETEVSQAETSKSNISRYNSRMKSDRDLLATDIKYKTPNK